MGERMRSARWSLSGLLALVLLASFCGKSRAQAGTTAFQAEHFEPAYAQGANLLQVYTSRVLAHLKPSGGLLLHYVKNPLVVVSDDAPLDVDNAVIAGELKAEVWAALGLFGLVEVGLVLPVALYQSGGDLALFGEPGSSLSGVGVGDLRFVPKVRALDPADFGGFGLAFALPVYVPLGGTGSFNSNGTVRLQPHVIADWRHHSGVVVAADLGYQWRPAGGESATADEDLFRWALGVQFPLGWEPLSGIASAFGSVQIDEGGADDGLPAELNRNPAEAQLAVQYRAPLDIVATLGAGRGLNRAPGSPAWRVFLSAGYTPLGDDADGDGILDSDDACPDEPEDRDGFEDGDGCPDPDNDRDGIADASDICPNDPEDPDDFDDVDGCPDPDNDGDGVPDVDDRCPGEPEDADGFDDEDGCPDPDNDGDFIPDAEDGCPNEPEDQDIFEDGDGCPDPDNDGDGVPDDRDQCPNNAETVNGRDDEDGCPDENEYKQIKVTRTRIEILDKVYFDSGKSTIQKRSHELLSNVAKVLTGNEQITRVRVEGHTDDRGNDAFNLRLSKARAKAVMDFLTARGVDPDVLVSEGYGESRPVMDNETVEGRAANRRVEFVILEIDGKPVKATNEVK